MENEKWRFIIKRGILGWGIPAWLTVALWESFLKPHGFIFDFGPFNSRVFIKYFLIDLPIFLVGGYFFGLWLWNSHKKNVK